MISRARRPSRIAGAALGAALLIGCSGSATAPPARGAIRLTVATTGANIDPDGYELDVFGANGTRTLTIQANIELLVQDLTQGQHQLQLKDVATNCAVDGANPIDATVVTGDTIPAEFDVTCQ
jgi:hypothetical protein